MAWSDACGLARPGTQIAWIALVQKLPGSPWYTNCPGSPRYKNCLDCPGAKIAWIALAPKLPGSSRYTNCLDLLGTQIAWSDAGSIANMPGPKPKIIATILFKIDFLFSSVAKTFFFGVYKFILCKTLFLNGMQLFVLSAQ